MGWVGVEWVGLGCSALEWGGVDELVWNGLEWGGFGELV